MKQALHIFKKDVRGLTYEVVVTLLLIAAFAVADSLANRWSLDLKLILPLSWWLLAARVVHAEAIPGDRQFWLTRPYSWKSLLAAKILFLVVFICIPMAISDAIVLHAQGLPVVSNAGGILWELLLRFNWILLVWMVVASLTRGLGSFAILSLIAVIAILFNAGFQAGLSSYGQLDWVIFAMGIGLIPAILFQYARHKKIAIALTTCVWLLPIAGVNLQLRLRPPIKSEQPDTGGPQLQFMLDPHPTRIFFPRSELKPFRIPVVLPIEILGIPPGLEMRSRTVGITLRSAAGPDAIKEWKGGLGSNDAVLAPDRSFPNPRFFWLEIMVPKEVYDRAAEQKAAVSIHVWAEITLYRNLASTPVGEGEFAVPGLGFCQSANGNALACRTALRHPSVEVAGYDIAGYRGATTEFPKRPFPAELGISPIVDFFLGINSRDVELITGDPVYRLQRTFDLSPVHLEDYVELRAK